MLPEYQVQVKAKEDGRWAQEPWKPQLEVTAGDVVTISVSFAMRLQDAGLCTILDSKPTAVPRQVKSKSEKNSAKADKKAAVG